MFGRTGTILSEDRDRQRPIKRIESDGDLSEPVEEEIETESLETKEPNKGKSASKKRKEPEPDAESDNGEEADSTRPAKRRAVADNQDESVPNNPENSAVDAKSISDDLEENDDRDDGVKILTSDAFPSAQELPGLLSEAHHVHVNPGNKEHASAFFKALETNTTVTKLGFNAENIDAESLEQLMDTLSQNSHVNHLTFAALGEQGAQAISSRLASNQSIRYLSLLGNNIRESGFNSICDALAQNRRLVTLDLSENDLEEVSTSHLGEALRQNRTLRKLLLKTCRIFGGFPDLFASLAQNQSLTELDYYFNDCEIEGLTKLLDALKTNKTLTRLSLGANGLGREGDSENACLALTRLFTELPQIKHLDLESSDIEDDLAVSMCKALEQNKTLISLNFKLNTLSDEGISAFARAIAKHPTLHKLKLQSTDGMMTNESLKEFIEALKTNTALRYLGLEDCDDDPDGDMEKIRSILEERDSGHLQIGESDGEN